MSNCLTISALTSSVAVAVSAIIGTVGNSRRSDARLR